MASVKNAFARPRGKGAAAAAMIVVAALTSCGGEGIDDAISVGTSEQSIVNGDPDALHPTVVKIISGNELCSGTLIGYRTVLTAAHCVVADAQTVVEVVGGGVAAGSFQVVAATVHPQFDRQMLDNDVAVLRLDRAPALTPTALAHSTPGTGTSVTLVGFGMTSTDANDQGTKRVSTTRIASVQAASIGFVPTFAIWGSICRGDSGGPTLINRSGREVQIGVHSYIGYDLGLLSSYDLLGCSADGWDLRVEAYLDWIRNAASDDVFVEGEPTPTPPSTEVSNTGDANDTVEQTTPAAGPSVTITAPANGSNLSSGMSITVEAVIEPASAPLVGADLFVNGALASSINQPPWSFPLTVPAGPMTIEVRAIDTAGQMGSDTSQVNAATSSTAGLTGSLSSTGVARAAENGGGGCTLAGATDGPSSSAIGTYLLLLALAWRRGSRRLQRAIGG